MYAKQVVGEAERNNSPIMMERGLLVCVARDACGQVGRAAGGKLPAEVQVTQVCNSGQVGDEVNPRVGGSKSDEGRVEALERVVHAAVGRCGWQRMSFVNSEHGRGTASGCVAINYRRVRSSGSVSLCVWIGDRSMRRAHLLYDDALLLGTLQELVELVLLPKDHVSENLTCCFHCLKDRVQQQGVSSPPPTPFQHWTTKIIITLRDVQHGCR